MLLQELVRFQERLFARDPIKAKARRRLVLGLREVTKHLRLRKIKLVVVSPNLERIQSKGGLDEALSTIVALCREHAIPLVFALGRRALGRACGKLVPVSVVGVFMYDGAETHFKRLMDLTQKARDAYDDMVKLVAQEAAEERQRVTSAADSCSAAPSRPSAAAAAAATPSVSADVSHSTAHRARSPQPQREAALECAASGSGLRPRPALTLNLAQQLPSRSSSSRPRAVGDSGPGSQVFVDDLPAASYRGPPDVGRVGAAADGGSDDEEAAPRRQPHVLDGDAGNEADVEDSLQDSTALDGYHLLLLNGGAGGGSGDRSPPLGAGSLARPAVGKWSQQADAGGGLESEGAEGGTAQVAGSATVTCDGGSNSSSSGSTAGASSSGGGHRRRNGRRAIGLSRTEDVAGGASSSPPPSAVVAATAVSQPLLLRGGGTRERVESWVAAHASAGGATLTPTVGGDEGVSGDPLSADDVAEFAATLSACTANSEALLLHGRPAAEPEATAAE